MTAAHITVAVIAHSETIVAGPAMHSAERAILAAEAEGLRVERLIGLDAASRECRAFFAQPVFASWKIEEIDAGDVSAMRNRVVEIATGRWMACLDAGDLFSENWLVASAGRLAEAERRGERVIVHPELQWVFGDIGGVHASLEEPDPLFSPHFFYFTNYYDALCMAPRRAVLDIPYRRYDIAGGFAYEGWPWSIETMAAGWRHVAARDTIIFKRWSDVGLTVRSERRRTVIWPLDALAIDRVRELRRDA